MKSFKLIAMALVTVTALALSTGSMFRAVGQSDSRIKELEAQVAHEPKNTKLIYALGWAYLLQGRQQNSEAIDKAITTFEQGISVAPDNRGMVRALGLAYFTKVGFLGGTKAGDTEMRAAIEKTLSAFEHALALTPDDNVLLSAHGSAQTVYAGVTRNPKLLDKGMEEMNRAVSLDPKSVHARLLRGFTGVNLPPPFRKPEVIIEDLRAVITESTYSENTQAQGVMRVLLGDLLLEVKNVDQAKAEYKTAASLDSPGAAEARARLVSLEQGMPDQSAIKRYRSVLISCNSCHKQ